MNDLIERLKAYAEGATGEALIYEAIEALTAQEQRIEELEEDLRRKRIYAINCKLRNVDPSVDEVHAELFKVQRQLDEAFWYLDEHLPEAAQRIREMKEAVHASLYPNEMRGLKELQEGDEG